MSHFSRGLEAELRCKAKLVELGFEVLEPLSQHARYDCLVLGRERFAKIQIKRAWREAGGVFRSRLVSGQGRLDRDYAAGDVDFFIVLVEDDFYVFPRLEKYAYPAFRARKKTRFRMEDYRGAWYLIKEKLGSCVSVNAKTVMRIISR